MYLSSLRKHVSNKFYFNVHFTNLGVRQHKLNYNEMVTTETISTDTISLKTFQIKKNDLETIFCVI